MKHTRKKGIAIFLIAATIFMSCGVVLTIPQDVQAAGNMIKGGGFEFDIDEYWESWKDSDSSRTYNFFRSYEPQEGSYSAAIEATGSAAAEHWDAGCVTKEDFEIESGKSYYLMFSAKGSANFTIASFLQNATTYAAITPIAEQSISTEWQKYTILLTPTSAVDANLSFVYGRIPNGGTLYIDGVQLVESNITSSTKEIKGSIGDKNKYVVLTNVGYFTENDISMEVPYYDNTTGNATRRRFHPTSVNSRGAYFNIEKQTFSGVAEVFVGDRSIGRFNYIVTPKVTEFNPSLLRGGEDLTVSGAGFIPAVNQTFVVVNVTGTDGKINEQWLTPSSIDSGLSQATVRLPVNVTSGKIYVYTGYMKADNTEGSDKSNILSYKVKPVVYGVAWSQKGYEQVGDKLVIRGRGFGAKPYVNFYDSAGTKIEAKAAKKTQVNDTEELIEVEATTKTNSFDITVLNDGIESDMENAINQSAKPNFTSITSKYSRTVLSTSEKIPAAKVGDEITLVGEAFGSPTDTVIVEFQGVNSRIRVNVPSTNIDKSGRSVKITVPEGAQSGYINVEAHEQDSNFRPLEIIPTIVSIAPNPIVPGNNFTIVATGVGNNINLLKIYFGSNVANQVEATPESVTFSGNRANIVVKAPLTIASQSSQVNIQYDRWKDSGSSVVNINPTVSSASINMDTKILTIRGYGFSVSLKENEVIYKYADADRTVVNPDAKILGIYPTEEGQEIRIKINDDYRYGYVSVRVGGQLSNEVNFGPASISKIIRRTEYVAADNAVRGVLYISGYNFGTSGGVRVGETWANVHYRTEFSIIAVVDESHLYDNPVIVTRQ